MLRQLPPIALCNSSRGKLYGWGLTYFWASPYRKYVREYAWASPGWCSRSRPHQMTCPEGWRTKIWHSSGGPRLRLLLFEEEQPAPPWSEGVWVLHSDCACLETAGMCSGLRALWAYYRCPEFPGTCSQSGVFLEVEQPDCSVPSMHAWKLWACALGTKRSDSSALRRNRLLLFKVEESERSYWTCANLGICAVSSETGQLLKCTV